MQCLLSKIRLNGALLLAAFLCFSLGQSAVADAYYDQGVRLYNQHNFSGAAPYFEASMRSSPSDSNACYYAALTYQQMGDWPRAKQTYRQIVKRFPGSQAAGLAQSVLQKYDPNFAALAAPAASGASSSAAGVTTFSSAPRQTQMSADYERLPRQSTVSFQRKLNSQIVEAKVNGRSIDVVFDTGASHCAFGKNHLQQLGIPPPSGPPDGYAYGVGSTERIPNWTVVVTLRVGEMELRNFPLSVQEDMPTDPLLGQTFFSLFDVTTDAASGTITFKKRGLSGSPRFEPHDKNNVPFTRSGNNMVVQVKVNGHPCAMYFDTGADDVAFSPEHLQSLGLEIPGGAQVGESTGVGGATQSVHFTIDDMELGPIYKTHVDVSVVSQSHMKYPLLGQSFFKDHEFTIDAGHSVIHFSGR